MQPRAVRAAVPGQCPRVRPRCGTPAHQAFHGRNAPRCGSALPVCDGGLAVSTVWLMGMHSVWSKMPSAKALSPGPWLWGGSGAPPPLPWPFCPVRAGAAAPGCPVPQLPPHLTHLQNGSPASCFPPRAWEHLEAGGGHRGPLSGSERQLARAGRLAALLWLLGRAGPSCLQRVFAACCRACLPLPRPERLPHASHHTGNAPPWTGLPAGPGDAHRPDGFASLLLATPLCPGARMRARGAGPLHWHAVGAQ